MDKHALHGTWRLVSFHVQDEDGRTSYPFGGDAVGFLTYTADGHMAVQFGRADRARLPAGDWVAAPSTEIAATARDYFAYCGTYELRDETVVHQVELSLMPNWIGAEQVRLVAFDGETVTLTPPPLSVGGQQQIATLVWRRV
jgi:Lipocalin-like domain